MTEANLDLSFARDVLSPVVDRQDLSREEATTALAAILAGSIDDSLIAAFLTAVTMKGETVDEMAGFVDAMMAFATPLAQFPDALDIVGTGGDQLHTVNISSMAAVVVAGAGFKVAKHGNRAASGSVGAADVFESLGVNITMSPATAARCLSEGNLTFLFAPTYHPALGRIAPIRRALGFRTVFNNLGPLANPAGVMKAVIGVSKLELLLPMAEVLRQRGVVRATLVRGDEGLDELSLGTTSRVIDLEDGIISQAVIDAPRELSQSVSVDRIQGGDKETNAQIFRDYLSGHDSPISQVVNANAALALMVAGAAATLSEGVEIAVESVKSGQAQAALDGLCAISHG